MHRRVKADEQLYGNSEVNKPIKWVLRIERCPKKVEGGGVPWPEG
jgi:hypothetical protein